jgi:hypothetical protein
VCFIEIDVADNEYGYIVTVVIIINNRQNNSELYSLVCGNYTNSCNSIIKYLICFRWDVGI